MKRFSFALLLVLLEPVALVHSQQSGHILPPTPKEFAEAWKAAKASATFQTEIGKQIKLTFGTASSPDGSNKKAVYSVDCLTAPKANFLVEVWLIDRYDPFAKGETASDDDKSKYLSTEGPKYLVVEPLTEAELRTSGMTLPDDPEAIKALVEKGNRCIMMDREMAKDKWGFYIRVLWRDPKADAKDPYNKASFPLAFSQAIAK